MTRAIYDFAQRRFFRDYLRFRRQHLRSVIVVLQLRQSFAAMHDVAFFDVNGFDLAAQFGAKLDVLREGLDLPGTCDQQRDLLLRRSRSTENSQASNAR